MGRAAVHVDLIPELSWRPAIGRASRRLTPPSARRRGPNGSGLAGLFVLAVLLVAAALPPAVSRFAARTETPGWAIESFRLRAAPTDKADRLLKLPAGAELTLLGIPKDGYYPVAWGRVRAWAPTGMVETPEKGTGRGPRDRKTRLAAQEIVAATELEVRTAASADAETIGAIGKGEPVAAAGEAADGFLRVAFGDGEGWVAADKLQAPKAPPAKGDYTRAEIKRIIYAAADRYGQNREEMLRVARCESDLIPDAVNAVGGSYGIFQFKPLTWARTPYAEYDIFDPVANAMAAAWLWSQGGKVEWVCQ